LLPVSVSNLTETRKLSENAKREATAERKAAPTSCVHEGFPRVPNS
jgi:hypothetical protein